MTNPTTKAVLDAMKADAEKRGVSTAPPPGGYAKAAPEAPRIPVRPLSGSVDELLTESKVHERAQTWKMRTESPEQLKEWRERIAAAPAKIAAAKERGMDTKAIKDAEAKVAEIQDKLTEAELAEVRWYMLDVASRIMIDFGERLKPFLPEEFDGTLTFDVPGVLTFRCDLTSFDEIPF